MDGWMDGWKHAVLLLRAVVECIPAAVIPAAVHARNPRSSRTKEESMHRCMGAYSKSGQKTIIVVLVELISSMVPPFSSSSLVLAKISKVVGRKMKLFGMILAMKIRPRFPSTTLIDEERNHDDGMNQCSCLFGAVEIVVGVERSREV